MFKKKPQLKPHSALRSSDRRKVAAEIVSELLPAFAAVSTAGSAGKDDPMASEAASLRSSLLPESAQAAKFATTAGPDLDKVQGTVYLGSHPGDDALRPLWVRVDGGYFFPTVETLWHNPGLLPLLLTHAPVIEKLRNGADLMVPGLIGPPFPAEAKKGNLVQIASVENPQIPLLVGVCAVDVCQLEKSVGEHGKAVRILHWAGDELSGGVRIPDILPVPEGSATPVAPGTSATNLDPAEENLNGAGTEKIRELDTSEIDAAFLNATLFGLHEHKDGLGSLDLPVSSSVFMSSLVLPFLPPASNFPPYNYLQNEGPHPSLQLKRSSWKNAARFLKHLEKSGLIKTKTRNGGETVITSIDCDTTEVHSFVPYKLPVALEQKLSASDAAGRQDVASVHILELYRPIGRVAKLFEAAKLSTSNFYSAADVKQALGTYVEACKLSSDTNKRMVKMDPVLAAALFPSPTDAAALNREFHKRDELANRLVGMMAPYYRIVRGEEESKPKPGPAPRIQMIVEKRQGKKTMTRITGLEPFSIPHKDLAEELQKICAGSATTGQAQGMKTGLMEVMVQGSQTKAVETCLEKRGVPKKFVVTVDKTTSKR